MSISIVYKSPLWLKSLALDKLSFERSDLSGGAGSVVQSVIDTIKIMWFDEFAKRPDEQSTLLREAAEAIVYVRCVALIAELQ